MSWKKIVMVIVVFSVAQTLWQRLAAVTAANAAAFGSQMLSWSLVATVLICGSMIIFGVLMNAEKIYDWLRR